MLSQFCFGGCVVLIDIGVVVGGIGFVEIVDVEGDYGDVGFFSGIDVFLKGIVVEDV